MLSVVTIVVAAAILTMRFGLRIVSISGHSMTPDFVPGERVLVLLFWPTRWIRIGQVVLIPSSPDPAGVRQVLQTDHTSSLTPLAPGGSFEGTERQILSWRIKRVVGVPGTAVKLIPIHNSVTSMGDPQPRAVRCTDAALRVPKNHLYVLGNTADSYDSRRHGPVRASAFVPVVITRMSDKTAARQKHPV